MGVITSSNQQTYDTDRAEHDEDSNPASHGAAHRTHLGRAVHLSADRSGAPAAHAIGLATAVPGLRGSACDPLRLRRQVRAADPWPGPLPGRAEHARRRRVDDCARHLRALPHPGHRRLDRRTDGHAPGSPARESQPRHHRRHVHFLLSEQVPRSPGMPCQVPPSPLRSSRTSSAEASPAGRADLSWESAKVKPWCSAPASPGCSRPEFLPTCSIRSWSSSEITCRPTPNSVEGSPRASRSTAC